MSYGLYVVGRVSYQRDICACVHACVLACKCVYEIRNTYIVNQLVLISLLDSE